MISSKKCVIELIKCEIIGNPINSEEIDSLTNGIIATIYDFAVEQDVAYIVASALSRLGLLYGDAKNVFFNEQLSSIYRYERIKHELETLSKLFELEGIAFVPLKGSVIRELYPKPEMRMSCDIDILIHQDDIKKAGELLESKLSYQYYSRCGYEVSWFSPSGVHLELHFNLFEEDVEKKQLFDSPWNHSILVEGSKYKYKLSNEFLIFYHVFHIAKHFSSGGCGIKPFIDLWIMKSKLEYDEYKLKKLFEKSKLVKFAEASFKLIMVLFENESGDELTKIMEDYVLDSGSFGTMENQIAISQSKKNGSKFRVIIDRIFLPYNILKDLYPVIVKYPILTPVCEIARWFRIIFKDKMKRQFAIIKHNATISEDKQMQVAHLLKELGLL